MCNIDNIRERIDVIDDQFTQLFVERMELCKQIGEEKAKNNLPLNVYERERQILSRVSAPYKDEMKRYVKRLYESVFMQSKTYQTSALKLDSPITRKLDAIKNESGVDFPVSACVACQGVKGAYSGIAAQKIFEIPTVSYFKTFDAVFSAVESGLCEYGILPIENSTAGSVSQVYDLMKKHNFYIVKSVMTQITHVLAAKKGESISDIKKVYSHKQALDQCAEYLKAMKVECVEVENTAVAGKMVAGSEEKGVGVICSDECAEIYGLRVLDRGVQDSGNNYTRFICISKELKVFKGADKISIMTALSNKPGSLNNLLSQFSALGLNLTKLESRPIHNSRFEFLFYFDFEGDVFSQGVLNLLAQLDDSSDKFLFLGSYKEVF